MQCSVVGQVQYNALLQNKWSTMLFCRTSAAIFSVVQLVRCNAALQDQFCALLRCRTSSVHCCAVGPRECNALLQGQFTVGGCPHSTSLRQDSSTLLSLAFLNLLQFILPPPHPTPPRPTFNEHILSGYLKYYQRSVSTLRCLPMWTIFIKEYSFVVILPLLPTKIVVSAGSVVGSAGLLEVYRTM